MGCQYSSFGLWHQGESLSLPPRPFLVPEPIVGARESFLWPAQPSPAVSHLGSHPAKYLKQPDNEACLWVFHCVCCVAEDCCYCGFCGRGGRGGDEGGGGVVRLPEAQLRSACT